MPQLCTSLTVITERPRPGVRLLRPVGEIDMATAPELRAALGPPPADAPDLVVDLGEVTLLSAAGLGVLVDCRRSLRTVLLARTDHVAVHLPLSCLPLSCLAPDEVFPRYPTVADALAALP